MSATPDPTIVGVTVLGHEIVRLRAENARLRAQVLPPWTCVGPDGTRYSVVHPDIVDLRPGPLDGLPLYARLLPFGVDSGGNAVAGQGGGGTG